VTLDGRTYYLKTQVEFGLIGCRRTLPSLQRMLDYLEDGLSELEQAAGL
jgi:hypothetical protein